MSLPDYLLDEPDECLCETHGRPRPCPYCRFEAMEFRADCLRDDQQEKRQL